MDDLTQKVTLLTQEYLVTKTVDGDTVVLETGEVVRYIGIDAPETSKGEECFATQSTNKNKEIVEGKLVRLEKDVSEIDKYQRLLRYVWVSDLMVNDYLIREGYAKASSYPPDIKYQDRFSKAEREAKKNNRGLWDICDKSLSISLSLRDETLAP